MVSARTNAVEGVRRVSTNTYCKSGACLLWVKSGNAHNEPMMSAFHPITTKQRTQFYVGFVPIGDIEESARGVSLPPSWHSRAGGGVVHSPRYLL
jgi:hypothetical protein